MSSQQPARLKSDDSLCSFCQQKPAAVTVLRPMPHRRTKRAPQSLCLLHYYSTSAVRENPEQHVTVSDEQEAQAQTPAMQNLFAEAFVQLQQKLQQETERSFAEQDPLAVLTDLHHRARKPPPPSKRNRSKEGGGGGFLRKVPLPARLVQTQQAQARQQELLLQRMKKATEPPKIDLSQRRKPSRKSIWNTILEEPRRKKGPGQAEPTASAFDLPVGPPCSSCLSTKVQQLGSHTSRNQDMAKGETWGSKDRGDDVIARYQCLQCGKTWHEEA